MPSQFGILVFVKRFGTSWVARMAPTFRVWMEDKTVRNCVVSFM